MGASRRAATQWASATRITRAYPALVAFLCVAVAALLLALAQGAKPFYYDSGGYWALSQTITWSSQIPFFDYESTGLRGYALPLLYRLLSIATSLATSNDSLVVRAFNAGLIALVSTVLVPRLAAITFPAQKWALGRRLIVAALTLLFWSGFLSFPLSDLPALTAALLALIAISRSQSPVWLFIAGISGGLALNMRPAYVLLAPLLVGLLIWNWRDQRGLDRPPTRWRALCGSMLIIGLLIVSIPQSIFQHREFDEYTPVPGSSDLTNLQYTAGLELQRYDTYVNGPPRMEYVDTRTESIVLRLEDGRVGSTGEYLGIIADHPVTMAGVFLRHIINGLDHRYTTPYVETLEADRTGVDALWHQFLRIGGFLLVFLAFLRIAWPSGRQSLGPAQWRYPAALLLISLSSLPSAVETRFLLPVFVLSTLLVVAPGWRKAIDVFWTSPSRQRTVAVICGAGAVYAFGVWAVAKAATDSLRLS